MRIPVWRVLIFALVIVLATYAVFPDRSDMLGYYIKSGKLQDAQRLLPEVMQQSPTPRHLQQAAKVFQDLGKPDKAIKALEELVQKKPRDIPALESLATYLQWNLRTNEASTIYEKLVALQPEDTERLQWLIAHYRLKGEYERESLAIARLIPRLGKQAAAMQKNFLPLLWEELALLAHDRLESGTDPLRDYLMQGLYVLWEQYMRDIDEGEAPDEPAYITYALEYFVDTDTLPQGKRFASALDARFRTGLRYRLQLATVMGWKELDDQVAAYMTTFEQQAPEDLPLLLQVVREAGQAGRLDELAGFLQKQAEQEPGLAAPALVQACLDVENGAYAAAMSRLETALSQGAAPAVVLPAVLIVSQWSQNKELMRQAVELARNNTTGDADTARTLALVQLELNAPTQALASLHHPDLHYPQPALHETEGQRGLAIISRLDAATLRAMAQVYLAANRPKRAFPLLLAVVDQETGVSPEYDDDLLQLMQTAVYANDQEMIATALKRVTAARAGNPLLARDARFDLPLAQGYLAVGEAEKAFEVFRRLAREGDGLDAAIDAAAASGKAELVDAALTLTEEQNALTTQRKRRLAEAYLTAQKPGKAFGLLAEVVQEERKAEDLVRMLEAASFSNNTAMAQRAAAIAENMMRADKRARALAPEQLLSLYLWNGQELKAAKMLENKLKANPNNVALLLNTARTYSFAERPDKSLEYYKRALELQPDNTEILTKVAEFASYANDMDTMLLAYEQLLQKGLLSDSGKLVLARALADEQDWESALPLLLFLQQRDKLPRYEGMLLARALAKNEQLEASTDVYLRLAREYENDIPYLARLGAEALFDDMQEVSLEIFERVLRLEPRNAMALKGKAMIEAENNDAPSAIATYNRYNKIYENDPESRFQLAELYSIEDFPDEAAKQYDKTMQALRRQGSLRPPKTSSEQARKAAQQGLRQREMSASQRMRRAQGLRRGAQTQNPQQEEAQP